MGTEECNHLVGFIDEYPEGIRHYHSDDKLTAHESKEIEWFKFCPLCGEALGQCGKRMGI